MTDCERVALKEILTPSVGQIEIEPGQLYKQVTARLWGKGLVLRGTLDGAEIAANRQTQVRTNQFLISKIDARHGAFGIVPEELEGAVVSNDFPVFDVTAEVALPTYVEWVSRTDWFIELCRQASEGSTNRVRLKEARFLAQTIPLPSLSDQRRIVARLDAAAAAVTARAKAAEAMERELATALGVAFKRIVANAPTRPMGEVAPLIRRPIEIDLDATYAELGVRSFGRGTFHKPNLPGIEIGSKRLFRIEPGDLVFNIVFAWEGAVAIAAPEDAGRVGSHRFLTCIPDPDQATADFLLYWFLSENGLQALGRASPGGAGRNRTLGLKALQAVQVPLPPLDAQLWFDRLQTKARVTRSAQAAAGEELSYLLPSLLDDLFDK